MYVSSRISRRMVRPTKRMHVSIGNCFEWHRLFYRVSHHKYATWFFVFVIKFITKCFEDSSFRENMYFHKIHLMVWTWNFKLFWYRFYDQNTNSNGIFKMGHPVLCLRVHQQGFLQGLFLESNRIKFFGTHGVAFLVERWFLVWDQIPCNRILLLHTQLIRVWNQIPNRPDACQEIWRKDRDLEGWVVGCTWELNPMECS